jgi:exonuclease III
MIEGTDSSTGQDVGMLTRIDPVQSLYRTESRVSYPIPSTKCNSTYTGTNGVSKHYITSMNINNMDIAIISMHLLAFPDDQNRCVQREAQATVMQQVVKPYIDKGYEVIVVGDFNDWDSDVLDSNNDVPISQVLSILKGTGSTYSLHNIAELMPVSERYSEWYDEDNNCIYKNSETSMIDHILVSNGLVNKITSAYIAHDLYTQSCDSDFYYSDHWPVVVVSI